MRSCVVILTLIASCGEVVEPPPPPAPTPSESREVTSGGAKLKGTKYTFDVQVGHAARVTQSAGVKFTLSTNAAVRP